MTEEHAADMYHHVGSHYVGVVDIKVKRRNEDDDGNRQVELVIEGIELAPLDDRAGTAEHLRRLTRALHYERGLAVNGGDQLPIDGAGDEPTVEQVRAAGRAHELDPEADERDAEQREHDEPDEQGAADEPADDGWSEPDDVVEARNARVASPFDVPDTEPEHA